MIKVITLQVETIIALGFVILIAIFRLILWIIVINNNKRK